MKVVEFDDHLIGPWQTCCDSSSQAWLYHRPEWIQAEATYLGARNLSFGIMAAGQLVGVQPLYQSDLGLGTWVERLVHSGLHRHTGLASPDGLGEESIRAVRSVAMAHIEAVAKAAGADRIQLNVQNLAPRSLTSKREEIPFWVVEHGFHLGLQLGPMGINPAPGRSTCAADQIIDLSIDESVLFARLDPPCRRAVRKAEEHGLTFQVHTDRLEVAVETYYALAVDSAKRTGEAIASLDYFKYLARALGAQDRLAVLFGVYERRPVAGLMLGLDKNSATFMGGVSDPGSLSMRPNDFIHWSAIRYAKNCGALRYRLGPIFPEVPARWPISKVSRFKGKFGATNYTTIQGSRFLSPEKYPAMGS